MAETGGAGSPIDESALVAAVRVGTPDARAVILTGSWARGVADASSDVDRVVVWAARHRAIQVGSLDGRLTGD